MSPVTPLASFDDMTVGQTFAFGSFVMTLPEILDFAHRWDPQPFHTDPEAAKASIWGGLVASGLHTQCAAFSLMIRSGLFSRISLGGTGQDIQWPAPVWPGDRIAMTGVVEALRVSNSKPDRGLARMRYTGRREADGVTVIEIVTTHILKR